MEEKNILRMPMVIAHNPLRERLHNLWCEFKYGIATRGIVDIDHPDSHYYASMNYSTIQKVLEHLGLEAEDVLVDIGSGKGRMLCCAARYPIRQVIGVDLSLPLCENARRNAEKMRGQRAPISVHHGLADEFDYQQGTVITLFNPFGASTLDAVLGKIRRDKDGGSVRIAYENPLYDEVFAHHQWLECYDFWDRHKLHVEHSVAFYRSKV